MSNLTPDSPIDAWQLRGALDAHADAVTSMADILVKGLAAAQADMTKDFHARIASFRVDGVDQARISAYVAVHTDAFEREVTALTPRPNRSDRRRHRVRA
jgi:hypothetical protein